MAFNEFLSSANYSAGDYVWLDRTLFRFVEDHPAGPWNGKDVQKVSSKHLVNMLEEKVDDSALTSEVTEILGEIATPVITEKVNEVAEPIVTEKVNEIADEILEAVEDKANAIRKTVTNSGIVSIDDGMASPVAELVVGIEPVQSGSGDPAPDNVRAISGWTQAKVTRTGKNLIPNTATTQTKNEVTFTVNSDGSITANTSETTAGTRWFDGQQITLKPGTYTLSGCPSGGGSSTYMLTIRDSSNSTISGIGDDSGSGTTFTLTETVTGYIKIRVASGQTLSNVVFKPQLESGSSASSYEAYDGESVTIALGDTIYGGSLDVLTGVLTVTHALIDLGTLTWTLSGTRFYYRFTTDAETCPEFISSSATTTAICTQYHTTSRSSIENDNYAFSIHGSGDGVYVTIVDSRYTDATAFTTAMSGVKLCYDLATPLTVQLTESDLNLLDGENHVWADCGDIESFVYRVGMKMYIDDTVATQQSIIGTAELGTATRDYSVNDFLLMNNTLYKVTSPIGTGNTITVGTNVQATTIAEQLSNLLNA